MEYFWAVLIFAGILGLTTMITGVLGLLIPITYAILGFILGAESFIMGIGGLLGNLINYYNTSNYINMRGAMSNAPRYSMLASIGYFATFTITIIFKYAFGAEMDNFNYWYLLIFALVVWIVLVFITKRNRIHSLDNFKQSVIKYKIVEKYNEDPKWAIYLYFDNGEEGWNQTIPGSFLAKNPENDLTFVHTTKDEALTYAKSTFKNSEYLGEE